jgi:hypothetical protein
MCSKLILLTAFFTLACVGSAQQPDKKDPPKKAEGGERGREVGRPGPGGPGGFGRMMPMPGVILPPFLQEQLKLSDEQKKEVEALQKDTNEKLDKILNEDQRKKLQEMRDRGPGPGRRDGGDGARPPRPEGDREKKGPPPETVR